MRDLHLSTSFNSQVEQICEFIVSHDKFLRSSVSDISKYRDRFRNEFKITTSSTQNLICLSILSWYLPEDLGVCLRMSLMKKWEDKDDKIIGEFLLKSKSYCLLFLQDTSLWHTRDFFGNILNRRRYDIFIFVKPLFDSLKPVRRKIRHRGYRDKGTLKLAHEIHELATCTAEQLKIEEEREIQLDTIQFLEGWLC